MNVENNGEPIPDFIEYKNYPIISMAFYSPKHDKIYISPLAKKYPRVHKHYIEHETKHYKYDKKPLYLSILCHYLLDWIDNINLLNLFFTYELIKCGQEFRKIKFSKEEIDNFNKEFSAEKYTKYWYMSILNFYLGSTGIITWGLISYIIFSHTFKNVLGTYVSTFFIISVVFYSHYSFEIKNIVKKNI